MSTPLPKLTINEVLGRFDNGGTIEELKEAIDEATTKLATARKGAKATVVLTLQFTKTGASQASGVAKTKTTVPQRETDETFFFLHPDGGLTAHNPEQPQLGGMSRAQ